VESSAFTRIHVAVENTYAGYITISDQLKEDSKKAIQRLKNDHHLKKLVILSGDKQQVVDEIAEKLGLSEAYGDMLPEDKYNMMQKALAPHKTVGYVGDGVNDAPVIKLADVGIAMGGIGSDVAIETSDIVIQTNQPSKLPVGMDIANFTHRVVWQNIGMALGIKLLVMGLAALGIATMWEAIFADVGVALLAIANAIRIQHATYE
jgi:Cd2+/Zn2+-exporting ATPase